MLARLSDTKPNTKGILEIARIVAGSFNLPGSINENLP